MAIDFYKVQHPPYSLHTVPSAYGMRTHIHLSLIFIWNLSTSVQWLLLSCVDSSMCPTQIFSVSFCKCLCGVVLLLDKLLSSSASYGYYIYGHNRQSHLDFEWIRTILDSPWASAIDYFPFFVVVLLVSTLNPLTVVCHNKSASLTR